MAKLTEKQRAVKNFKERIRYYAKKGIDFSEYKSIDFDLFTAEEIKGFATKMGELPDIRKKEVTNLPDESSLIIQTVRSQLSRLQIPSGFTGAIRTLKVTNKNFILNLLDEEATYDAQKLAMRLKENASRVYDLIQIIVYASEPHVTNATNELAEYIKGGALSFDEAQELEDLQNWNSIYEG